MLTLVFYAVLTVAPCALAAPTSTSVDLLMPEVQPHKPDTYLCRSFDVADMKPYITGFIPNANMDIAHHILLYGCEEPGSQQEIWNCGEMATTSTDYETGPVCAQGAQKILYAWAMDAPSLTLPNDVAFKVGEGTEIRKLAMQVHYKNVTSFLPPQNKKDSSGLTLITTDEPKGRQAGVYLMVTGGLIPSSKIEYLETACPYPETPVEIHPFAFRTHTHSLGRVVSGYRVRDGRWTEIGRQDPQKPQMFYNATTPNLTVQKGDILAARCTMENNLDHDVAIGSTQKDEMCNFYIMYYVNGNTILNNGACFSQGGPNWYMKDYEDQEALNLPAMPDTASVVPDSGRHLLPSTLGALEEVQAIQEAREMEVEEDEDEDESPAMVELLDQYMSQMAPEELEDVVSEVLQEQKQQPYPALRQYRARPLPVNEEYGYGGGYYYPGDNL